MPKINDKTYKILQIGIKIAVLLVVISAAYAALNGRVSNVETIATKAEAKADSNELTIVELKTDVKYIRKSIDRQEILLHDIQEKL